MLDSARGWWFHPLLQTRMPQSGSMESRVKSVEDKMEQILASYQSLELLYLGLKARIELMECSVVEVDKSDFHTDATRHSDAMEVTNEIKQDENCLKIIDNYFSANSPEERKCRSKETNGKENEKDEMGKRKCNHRYEKDECKDIPDINIEVENSDDFNISSTMNSEEIMSDTYLNGRSKLTSDCKTTPQHNDLPSIMKQNMEINCGENTMAVTGKKKKRRKGNKKKLQKSMEVNELKETRIERYDSCKRNDGISINNKMEDDVRSKNDKTEVELTRANVDDDETMRGECGVRKSGQRTEEIGITKTSCYEKLSGEQSPFDKCECGETSMMRNEKSKARDSSNLSGNEVSLQLSEEGESSQMLSSANHTVLTVKSCVFENSEEFQPLHMEEIDDILSKLNGEAAMAQQRLVIEGNCEEVELGDNREVSSLQLKQKLSQILGEKLSKNVLKHLGKETKEYMQSAIEVVEESNTGSTSGKRQDLAKDVKEHQEYADEQNDENAESIQTNTEEELLEEYFSSEEPKQDSVSKDLEMVHTETRVSLIPEHDGERFRQEQTEGREESVDKETGELTSWSSVGETHVENSVPNYEDNDSKSGEQTVPSSQELLTSSVLDHSHISKENSLEVEQSTDVKRGQIEDITSYTEFIENLESSSITEPRKNGSQEGGDTKIVTESSKEMIEEPVGDIDYASTTTNHQISVSKSTKALEGKDTLKMHTKIDITPLESEIETRKTTEEIVHLENISNHSEVDTNIRQEDFSSSCSERPAVPLGTIMQDFSRENAIMESSILETMINVAKMTNLSFTITNTLSQNSPGKLAVDNNYNVVECEEGETDINDLLLSFEAEKKLNTELKDEIKKLKHKIDVQNMEERTLRDRLKEANDKVSDLLVANQEHASFGAFLKNKTEEIMINMEAEAKIHAQMKSNYDKLKKKYEDVLRKCDTTITKQNCDGNRQKRSKRKNEALKSKNESQKKDGEKFSLLVEYNFTSLLKAQRELNRTVQLLTSRRGELMALESEFGDDDDSVEANRNKIIQKLENDQNLRCETLEKILMQQKIKYTRFWKSIVEELKIPLVDAVAAGAPNLTRLLLDDKAKAQLIDSSDNTAMHLASRKGNMEVGKILIGAGVNVNRKNELRSTPLLLSIYSGHINFSLLLLRSGADLNATDASQCTPLHMAALTKSLVLVKALIEDKADVNVVDLNGDTPMFFAAVADEDVIGSCLLEAGGKINCTNNYGDTPLHLASLKGSISFVYFLLDNKADIDVLNHLNMTPLHSAAVGNHSLVVDALLDAGAKPDTEVSDINSPLHIAARYGNLYMTEVLVAAGANVSSANSDGWTPLHYAASGGFQELSFLLLSNKAAVNFKDKQERTPLHVAVTRKDNIGVIDALLSWGADFSAVDCDDKTPLDLAKELGDDEAAKWLENQSTFRKEWIEGNKQDRRLKL